MTNGTSAFKQLPLSDLRTSLPKFKRQVQLGMKRIAATYYGQVVGFLVPLKDILPLEADGLIENTEEMSLSDFRSQLTECWERLQLDVDCIYLTYHTRRAAVFVSPRFMPYLPIPVAEVSHKLLAVTSEILEATPVVVGSDVESTVKDEEVSHV
ncbi:MAG: prevent-host-death family protein [Cyanobacteria bacterium P01_E01_bin.6]